MTFDTHHPSLYDFGCLLSEFFQQVKDLSNSGLYSSYTYEQLIERSQILVKWVDLLSTQHRECIPHLTKTFQREQFESLLIHIRKVYSHPLFSSVWLGLEMTTTINNSKQETEFLRYIVVATHYDHKIIEQFKRFIHLIPDVIHVEPLREIIDSATNHEMIDNIFIKKLITLSAPVLFQMAALGRKDLAASGLEIYHHYITYLDNIRLKQAYHAALGRIQNNIPKQYKYDESIYTTSNPIFDAHVAVTKNYIDKNTNLPSTFLNKKNIELSNNIQSLFTKLESNIEFVCTLRGRLIRFKSKNYLYQIKDILHQSISSSQKAHSIELITSGWYGWVKKRYRDESILINECLSMASALATKMRDQLF
ncbi:MAG: hypothetical protein A3F13_01170 [Gammaproteobacteria bacterium RIFCSPHIGHO2_12_FULL_40_19]|nr:MAG: hypothetical protein A3F13_01170 [Gammaproteobacteria bacterium RIFCSPHIGHO2_12_FULL_40_19]HLB42941.1 hypothetical protein [Gammaproteobacteria bacterium]